MDVKEYQTSEGCCIISEEVIAKIAATAAVEVPGVASMANRLTDIRGLVNTQQGNKNVGVINNEHETVVDLYINLCEGVRIPDVAGEVQRQVKSAVQSMTGKPVTKVNVHIAGLVFNEEKPAEPAEEQ